MPCCTDISLSDEYKHLQVMLCKALKFLSKEQIESLTNPGSGIYDGIDWYSSHLFGDYCWSESTQEDKNIALRELNRIGYDIKDCTHGGWELINDNK